MARSREAAGIPDLETLLRQVYKSPYDQPGADVAAPWSARDIYRLLSAGSSPGTPPQGAPSVRSPYEPNPYVPPGTQWLQRLRRMQHPRVQGLYRQLRESATDEQNDMLRLIDNFLATGEWSDAGGGGFDWPYRSKEPRIELTTPPIGDWTRINRGQEFSVNRDPHGALSVNPPPNTDTDPDPR